MPLTRGQISRDLNTPQNTRIPILKFPKAHPSLKPASLKIPEFHADLPPRKYHAASSGYFYPCLQHIRPPPAPAPKFSQPTQALSSHRRKLCAHLLNLESFLTPVETSRFSQSGVMASGPQAGAGPTLPAATKVAAIFLRHCHKATVVKRSVTVFSRALKPSGTKQGHG